MTDTDKTMCVGCDETHLQNLFHDALKKHDWYFEYSDGSRVWYKGRQTRAQVDRLARRVQDTLGYAVAKKIWEEHAPEQFRYPLGE